MELRVKDGQGALQTTKGFPRLVDAFLRFRFFFMIFIAAHDKRFFVVLAKLQIHRKKSNFFFGKLTDPFSRSEYGKVFENVGTAFKLSGTLFCGV